MRYFYTLDKNDNPVPCDSYLDLPMDRRRVAYDKIDEVEISTVFFCINHNLFQPNEPPILYETMVFGGDHDGYQRRYTNRTEALAGHAETLAMVKTP